MWRMIMLFSVVIILFGVAAGASWYLQAQQKDHETPHVAEEKKKSNSNVNAVKPSVGEGVTPKSLIRSPSSPDTERLAAMATSLQSQQELLKAREQQIAVREKQMDIIHEEIKKEQKRLDAIKKKIDEEMLALNEKIEHLERRAADNKVERTAITSAKQDVEQMTLRVDELEWMNIKAQVKTFDKMDPETANMLLVQMVDAGKLDTAAKILANVEKRQAAAIFAEMSKNEPKLSAQIVERILQIKSPTVAAPK